MICNASERNRVLTRWLSASAVRFIGSQRFSITIENDVSTSSATAACVRVSVSEISTSSTVIFSGSSDAPGAGLAQHRVGQRAGDVPRLGVAELPRPRGAGQLAGRTRAPGVAFAVPARKLLRHIT